MKPTPVLVFGSLNADLVIRADRLPRAGETLQGGDLAVYPGGKGANQACAAARLGADVRMFGAVGRDVFGDLLLESLRGYGADASGVRRLERSTGSASITVLPNGDNAILLAPGANGAVDASWVDAMGPSLGDKPIVLCQLEVPLPAVEALLVAADAKGARVILDPAPAYPLSPELLVRASIVTPNQTEAALLIGRPEAPPATYEDAREVCRLLHERGVRTAIVKMGEQGCLVSDGGEPFVAPAHRVKAVDTTAAGDTFNGALAAALAEGLDLRAAVAFGNAAAAISVTRPGAQSSAPERAEVERLLQQAAQER
ncbi:MAG: ribokinase [Acidobacteria bacterium]|nr:ribokinase [Acidobacteriota bacterium]